jgi:23S rRNA (cytosine1962-C5)-methyltransferase
MEKNCQVRKNHETKFRQGYPLLFPEALQTTAPLQKEGQIFRLTTKSGEFLARGYYGKQNKGLGWILTQKEEEQIDFTFFLRKLSAALARRQKFYFSEETTAFRVFNGEGDGIGGLTIDHYDGYYLFQWYSKGIYAFHEEIYRAFSQITVSKGVYQKRRYQIGGKVIEEDSFVSGERFDQTFPVKESGLSLHANLNDGAMTGFFLDQRNVRKQIMELYGRNRRVLNTFSYTGAFSVFAAKGGSLSTTSIDLAKRSLEKTKANFILNDIKLEANEIVVDEISAYFAAAKEEGKRYDLIILDPPSYSRSKNFSFSAQKDYTALVEQALPILDKNGILMASTNCSLFDMKEFQEMVKKGFRKFNRKYRVLESFQLPADFPTHPQFPEGNYLKVFFIQHV